MEKIMTPEHVLKTVAPSDTVLEAMELMIDNNFRHVPVVSADKRLFAGCLVRCDPTNAMVNTRHCPALQVDDGNYLGMISIRDAVSCQHRLEHLSETSKCELSLNSIGKSAPFWRERPRSS